MKKIDLLAMGQDGVVKIPSPIIDPKFKNIVAIASSLHSVGYNPNLLPASQTPNSWEDFLRPEFKGRKFMVDIRPQGFAALAAGMGEEWTVNYARANKEQDPVWVRGQSRVVTAMATGEQSISTLTTTIRASGQRKKTYQFARMQGHRAGPGANSGDDGYQWHRAKPQCGLLLIGSEFRVLRHGPKDH